MRGIRFDTFEETALDGERTRINGRIASGPLTAAHSPVPDAEGATRWKLASLMAGGMSSRSPDSAAVSRGTNSIRLRASRKPTIAANLEHGPQLSS